MRRAGVCSLMAFAPGSPGEVASLASALVE
jgi:hypothetical protein